MSTPQQPQPGAFGGPASHGQHSPAAPGQQPHVPGPFGGPTSPTPPPRKSRGTALGVVIFATVIVMLAIGGVVWQNSSDGAEVDSAPPRKYKLTLPKQLLEMYHLQNESDAAPRGDGNWSTADVTDWKAITGDYSDTYGKPSVEGLFISGMYGDVKQPDRVREALLRGAIDRDDTVVAVRPKRFSITESDLENLGIYGEPPMTVSCQVVVRGKSKEAQTTLPVCAWADDSTAASIAFVTPATSKAAPKSVDLREQAKVMVDIRDKMRKRIY